MFLDPCYQIDGSSTITSLKTRLLFVSNIFLFSLQDYIFLSDQGGLQIQAYHKNDGSRVKTYTVDATPHHLVIAGQVSDPPTGQCNYIPGFISRSNVKCINSPLCSKSSLLLAYYVN